MRRFKIFLELTKFPIPFFASLSAGSGFVIGAERVDRQLISVILGLFLLASGATCLNEIQERELDEKMQRTGNRPIPSGRIRIRDAVFLSIFLILSGIVILLYFNSLKVMLTGLIALILYNGIYTPLKRKTSLAFLPGSLIGVIPPFSGYLASGMSALSPGIFILCVFFFMFQIPHFWLLLMEYRDDYKRADVPVFIDKFPEKLIERITCLWILSLLILSLVFFMYSGHGVILFPLILFLLLFIFIKLSGIFRGQINYLAAFKALNIYVFTFNVIIIFSVLLNTFQPQ